MAAVHGKNTNFQWNSVDISAYLTDVSFPIKADTADVSAFGATYKTAVVGLKDASFSVSGIWDAQASGSDATLGASVGTSAAFIYGPAGSTAGFVKYTGTAILTDYVPKGTIGGAVLFTATFQNNGTITRTTF